MIRNLQKVVKPFSYVVLLLTIVAGLLASTAFVDAASAAPAHHKVHHAKASKTAQASVAPQTGSENQPTDDYHLSVTATDVDSTSVSDAITGSVQTLINGATQLLWWYPHSHLELTMKQVSQAPHIKAHYTACSQQSKAIAKQTHGATIVVLKVGSTACNTGKLGKIVGGFKWTVKVPAVLQWNSKLHLYQHVASIIHGKLVPACKNHIGGHVDQMFPHVAQVRYQQDVLYTGNLSVNTSVKLSVTFHLSCSNGSGFDLSASANGSGSAGESVLYTERTRATVTASEHAKFQGQSLLNAKANGTSVAGAQIDISAHCGTPSNPGTPHLDLTPGACVQQGGTTGVVDYIAENGDSAAHNGTVSITAKGVPAQNVAIPASSSVSGEFNGLSSGTFTVTLTLDNGQTVSQTTSLQQCTPPPVTHYTNLSCTSPEEVTVGGSLIEKCSVSNDNGAPISLSVVSNNGNADVSGIICTTNGQPTCPSGGTFEFSINGRQVGTYSVDATATSNGVNSNAVHSSGPVDPEDGGF